MLAATNGGFFGGFSFIFLLIAVLVIAGYWKVFAKADQPGWAAIIPIYNIYIMCKVAKRPGWWLILFFVPLLNIFIAFIVIYDIARYFSKGAGFAIGMYFLSPIFIPILGFGSDQYQA